MFRLVSFVSYIGKEEHGKSVNYKLLQVLHLFYKIFTILYQISLHFDIGKSCRIEWNMKVKMKFEFAQL